jgi:hypothetical protein
LSRKVDECKPLVVGLVEKSELVARAKEYDTLYKPWCRALLSLVIVGCETRAAQSLVREVLRANRAGDQNVQINSPVVGPGAPVDIARRQSPPHVHMMLFCNSGRQRCVAQTRD